MSEVIFIPFIASATNCGSFQKMCVHSIGNNQLLVSATTWQHGGQVAKLLVVYEHHE
jgi:hypothetical protein